MRLQVIPLIICMIVNLLLDYWIFMKLKRVYKSRVPARSHLAISIFLLIYILSALFIPRRTGSNDGLLIIMWMLFSYMTFYVPKYISGILCLISSIPLLWKRNRIPHLPVIGVIIGAFSFVFMWWGALITSHETEVTEISVPFPNLPSQYDGYRIVQFSDFHVGTYGTDTAFVSKVVTDINNLHPDIIFFTGDIVNRETAELSPFIDILKRLKARDGVYSILGNHDYGDYMDWKDAHAKEQNNQQMKNIQAEMGWIMLNNDNRILKRGNDSIALIGVENWGDPPFKTYGDLKKSYPTLNDSVFKILLSHNPAHWRNEVIGNTNIDLMFAGHTHAMQMMLKLGNYTFSPAEWRYKEWGGLYSEGDQKLYVNIGIGEVALPMRLGAVPEITLMILKKGE